MHVDLFTQYCYDCRNLYAAYSEPEDFLNESNERSSKNDSQLYQVISNVEKIQDKTLSPYETNTVNSYTTGMKSELCENNQELHVLSSSQG